MSKSAYFTQRIRSFQYDFQIADINKLQTDIMIIISVWSKAHRKPIARKMVIKKANRLGVNDPTVISALNVLIKKGYIRRAIGTSNKTFYVQLRGV